MPLLLVLAVGTDRAILSTRSSVLRSAGHVVKEASSADESIELFKDSDFDVVVLCHSLPAHDRDRLTRAIRALGSRIPIYTVAPVYSSRGFSPGLADGILSSNPEDLTKELEAPLRPASFKRAPVRDEPSRQADSRHCS